MLAWRKDRPRVAIQMNITMSNRMKIMFKKRVEIKRKYPLNQLKRAMKEKSPLIPLKEEADCRIPLNRWCKQDLWALREKRLEIIWDIGKTLVMIRLKQRLLSGSRIYLNIITKWNLLKLIIRKNQLLRWTAYIRIIESLGFNIRVKWRDLSEWWSSLSFS